MQVRTASNTVIHLVGPNTYVRTREGGVSTQHQCIAWGALVPLDATAIHGEGAFLVMLLSGGLVPVRMLVGKVMPGVPLGFLALDKEGATRVYVSTPVVELDGKLATPEGMAGELPDHLKKLLEGGNQMEGAGA